MNIKGMKRVIPVVFNRRQPPERYVRIMEFDTRSVEDCKPRFTDEGIERNLHGKPYVPSYRAR